MVCTYYESRKRNIAYVIEPFCLGGVPTTIVGGKPFNNTSSLRAPPRPPEQNARDMFYEKRRKKHICEKK